MVERRFGRWSSSSVVATKALRSEQSERSEPVNLYPVRLPLKQVPFGQPSAEEVAPGLDTASCGDIC